MKIIISGGGTGGHIYPAIAIANALRSQFPGVDILFVGAEGRMEMEKVPAAGYTIAGLPVAGLQRKLTWKNLLLPYKLWKSVRKASQIINSFQPDVVVGVGGYASAPVLWTAQRKNIPTVIQEQNSYAGVTNKLLAKRASKICVAYEGMERFFPKEKIILTGNPVRWGTDECASRDKMVASQPIKRINGGFAADKMDKACLSGGAAASSPRSGFYRCEAATLSATQWPFIGGEAAIPPFTVLVVGGSLGARTLNQAMMQALPELRHSDVHFIWQTGKSYFEQAKAAVTGERENGERRTEKCPSGDKAATRPDKCASRDKCPAGDKTFYPFYRPRSGHLSVAKQPFIDCLQPIAYSHCDPLSPFLPFPLSPSVTVVDFISRMDEAFAAADVVVSRAGAGTISELCVAAKACVLVPSPNVAEDHQTKNAQALVDKNAAIMVRDDEAKDKLLPTVLALLQDKARIRELEKNIAALAKPNAADEIAKIIIGEREKGGTEKGRTVCE